jgi:hypothetical protein
MIKLAIILFTLSFTILYSWYTIKFHQLFQTYSINQFMSILYTDILFINFFLQKNKVDFSINSISDNDINRTVSLCKVSVAFVTFIY